MGSDLVSCPEDVRMSRRVGWSAVVVVCLLAWAPGPVEPQPLFGPTQDPLAGARVFGEKGCARCHAINGVGGRVGPDLGRLPRPHSFYDLAAAMWNHLPQMGERMRQLGIPRPRLDARETSDLIAFLFTANYFDPPGNTEQGRRLFSEKRCVVCHQVGGTGGVVGPNLDFLGQYGSPIFVATAMWNHGPAMAEAMRARGIPRPHFEGSELADLIAYLRSASPERAEEPLYLIPGRAEDGRRLFVEKRCVQCHGPGGRGGGIGPDLAGRGREWSLMQFAAAMWNKAPAMTAVMETRGIPVPQLRPAEVADLVAYLYRVRYLATPGDPGRGREVVTAKGCLGCHSIEGRGGKTASDLARAKDLDSPATVAGALWNHSFERASALGPGPWPELRASDMADLVAFLGSVARGR
jgi:mono/diheme cytochrome c family protein